jgi:hypothetical protein
MKLFKRTRILNAELRKREVNKLLNELIQAARQDITEGLKSSDNYYTRKIEQIYKEGV